VEQVARWKGGFNGFAFRLPPALLRAPTATAKLLGAMRLMPQIKYIEPDQVYYAQVIMSESRGGKWEVPTPLFRMRAAAWSTKLTDGALVQPACNRSIACSSVVVAVLDTGIDGTHPDLEGNIVGGESFIGGNPLVDENGHGTHVAGTVSANNNGQGTMGLTPGQKVYALQVFDQLGSGSTSSIVAALNWLARYGRSKGIRVANMSLGGPKSYAVCAALDAVVRQGITMVVAAGNKGVSMYSSSPADCNNALAVTSMTDYDGKPGGLSTPDDMTNADDTYTDFSNYAATFSSNRVVAAPGACVAWMLWCVLCVANKARRRQPTLKLQYHQQPTHAPVPPLLTIPPHPNTHVTHNHRPPSPEHLVSEGVWAVRHPVRAMGTLRLHERYVHGGALGLRTHSSLLL